MSWRSFSTSDYALKEKISSVEKMFSLERINKDIEYAVGEIADLQAAIQRCQKLLSHAYYQKGLIETITFSYSVFWNRSKLSGSPVYYYLGVYRTPNITNGSQYRDSIECKRFQGKEKKLAKEYAEKLCKLYNCDIESVAIRR